MRVTVRELTAQERGSRKGAEAQRTNNPTVTVRARALEQEQEGTEGTENRGLASVFSVPSYSILLLVGNFGEQRGRLLAREMGFDGSNKIIEKRAALEATGLANGQHPLDEATS